MKNKTRKCIFALVMLFITAASVSWFVHKATIKTTIERLTPELYMVNGEFSDKHDIIDLLHRYRTKENKDKRICEYTNREPQTTFVLYGRVGPLDCIIPFLGIFFPSVFTVIVYCS